MRWTRQIRRYPQDVHVLCNAAKFLSDLDWPESEKLYRRARKIDPTFALPARRLAYAYRFLASVAHESDRKRLVRRALLEAEAAASLREKSRGELIGVLQEFAPLAIKFGRLQLARKFARRLLYYGEAFYLWRQYAYLYLAWLDLRECRWRGVTFKLQRLRELFEEEPTHVASCNAAISFVNDALNQGEEYLAQYLLQILILGSCGPERRREKAELEEWLDAICSGRKPKLTILKKELNQLF